MEKATPNGNKSRREFVKKVAYVAPVVITLAAAPKFAQAASAKAGGRLPWQPQS
jgi:hypothetical protein